MTLATTLAAGATPLERETAARNAWIEVDLEALAANVGAIKGQLGHRTALIAVVKANAYGHGTKGVFAALESAGADRFAVVWAKEAIALRKAGARLPVLVLGHAFAGEAAAAVEHDITLTIHSRELAEAVAAAAVARGRVARIHIKVDTGLHRFGVEPREAIALAEFARTLPGVEVEGLWTHMANADEADDSFAEVQQRVFAEVARALPWIPFRHTANSATALRRPEFAYEGVRCGLAVYGLVPAHTPDPGLRPALSLKARVARVAAVRPGEGVSYGLTWKAERESRVALIPVGYADGWRRDHAVAGEVLVRGQRCPVAGRICMDQFLVDVTGVPGVAEGDEAVLLGRQGEEAITANDVAAQLGTISWEVLASLQTRLPRIYHRGGEVEQVVE